jgi:hypothetical protein
MSFGDIVSCGQRLQIHVDVGELQGPAVTEIDGDDDARMNPPYGPALPAWMAKPVALCVGPITEGREPRSGMHGLLWLGFEDRLTLGHPGGVVRK